MESIAVVKRRGRDFWPCTAGFGGPVCRVGGKLHRIPQMPRGVTYPSRPRECIQYVRVLYGDGPLVVPARCIEPQAK